MTKIKQLEWFGVLNSVIGAFLIAYGVTSHAFTFFTIGALCLITASIVQRIWTTFTVNAVFLVANIIGLIRNF